ncbi:MAG TPA: acyl-CoA dehydrogenase family protein [Anaerolineae bacterium]|nr:acyl-CoA dehydrogenase family protein [Anaerolineae bacterium]
MLDFRLDDEQKMLTESIRRYAEERMRKVFRDAEEEGKIPAEVTQAGWEIGLVPSAIPEEYGGFGDYSAVTSALGIEQLAWGDLAIALRILAPGAVAMPIVLSGTEAQKEAHLPLFCEEAIPNVAAALTEPRVLYDARALATTATRDGDFYVLNGVKSVVPLADTAETFLVYANEDGQTQAFFVPADSEGLKVGARDKLMGLNALPTFRLELDNCRVPVVNRLGGDAGLNFDLVLNHSRMAMAAAAVGVARAGLEYAKEYAKQRVQFGEPIAHKQSIAFMLAEMAIDIDAAQMMVWEVAWKLDQGQDALAEATELKFFVDDMVVRVADGALQTLGGYGYMREYPVELWLRNARGFATFDGLAVL